MGAHRETARAAQQAARDDRAVFTELYPTLRRFAAVVADLDMEPDDLVQDALTATLRRHELSEIHQPAAYLKQAIVHAVAGQRRRSARFRKLAPKLGRDTVGRDHYPSDLAILDVLQPIDRAVVFMADVEGLPGVVIAEQLGLTPGAVRKRVSRSRKQLRQLLRPDIAAVEEDQT